MVVTAGPVMSAVPACPCLGEEEGGMSCNVGLFYHVSQCGTVYYTGKEGHV